ncbi:hypothetical protein [Micromonospora sp. NPDC005652]|uniref:hypothetical protein n=1 Tax=Micromonospora sp. NPDC005652 TaxID=3157046 RepID=UPI0033E0D548
MSDVGDAVELTLATAPGATVTARTYAPDGTVGEEFDVPEKNGEPGAYPFAFQLTQVGMWRVTFTASGTATATEHFWVYAEVPGVAPLATADQLAGVFRPLSYQEAQTVTAWLGLASELLRDRFPDLDARIARGELSPKVAAAAAIAMVLRITRNPGGLRAETVGPFRREFTAEGASAALVVTQAEVDLLAPKQQRPARQYAGTIRVTPGLSPRNPLWRGRDWRW